MTAGDFVGGLLGLVCIGGSVLGAGVLVLELTPQIVQEAAPLLELGMLLATGIGAASGAHWLLERLVSGA